MTDLAVARTTLVALDSTWEWQLRARCRGRDLDVFFHPSGEREPSRSARESAAKALCAACEVRPECAAFALRAAEPYGVWGGLSESERDEQLFGPRPPRRR